jgi:hypothetical protein
MWHWLTLCGDRQTRHIHSVIRSANSALRRAIRPGPVHTGRDGQRQSKAVHLRPSPIHPMIEPFGQPVLHCLGRGSLQGSPGSATGGRRRHPCRSYRCKASPGRYPPDARVADTDNSLVCQATNRHFLRDLRRAGHFRDFGCCQTALPLHISTSSFLGAGSLQVG